MSDQSRTVSTWDLLAQALEEDRGVPVAQTCADAAATADQAARQARARLDEVDHLAVGFAELAAAVRQLHAPS